jgi:hypothetical protein
MRIKQSFVRATEDSLIIVPCKLDDDTVSLAIDTGASHTTIDLTPLLLAGYNLTDAIGKQQIETASGVLDAFIFNLKEFTCLGITKTNFTVSAYDFFSYHYLTDFDGVVGLDFFKGTKFCIDMEDCEITITTKK